MLALAGAIAAGVSVWSRRAAPLPPVAEFTAATSTTPADIAVGPNVPVSTPRADKLHREVLAVADPTDPKKLVAAAMCEQPGGRFAVVGYRSADGGTTWQPSFDRDRAAETQADPTFACGPDGLLYLAIMSAPHPYPSGPIPMEFRFFRSADAGTTWADAGVATGPGTHTQGVEIDRPFIAADRTTGPFRGRLYCASLGGYFHTSTDQGRTFRRQKLVMDPRNLADFSSNPVTLSDGTMVFAHQYWLQERFQPCGLAVVDSADGGDTLRPLARLTPRWRDETRFTDAIFSPALAADHRDRLFAVWGDGDHPGRDRVLFARSDDKGRTWTRPAIISEQPADGTGDYSCLMPALAVTRDGVVGVSWYDRRGRPLPARGDRARDNMGAGCDVRLRVSLDGGDTWQPSVPVNSAPIKAKVWDLRDTAGVVADADGAFHPFWIDDRTGVLQVWTAAVTIHRK